ncbi:hypothetical protein [Caenimonas koreensis]|uniref:hypothetical protein n=1 Tax=Caenimonas koreensis TaxID=367474 RepID=UPI003783B19C
MLANAIYAITALQYAGPHIVGAMMGLMDTVDHEWDLPPAPARLNDVVDRLVEGDRVISVFADESGWLACGPEVKVDVLADSSETLALAEDQPGRSLRDLPTY